ncbi:TadE/TadG family type IV pilus assembly protein [Celeribacter sp. ULVN23_4]
MLGKHFRHASTSLFTKGRKRFQRDESGSVAIEALLVTPGLIIFLMFVYTAFSAFQAKAQANKANYTISDYISRQTDTIDDTFLDGLAQLYEFLNNYSDTDMRISAVEYYIDEDENEGYDLVWSYATGDYTKLTDNTVSEVEERIPLLADGEQVLVVETARAWSPIFNVFLSSMTFTDIVTTKPRFATQVDYEGAEEEEEASTSQDSNDNDVESSGDQSDSNTSSGNYNNSGGRYNGSGYHSGNGGRR